MKLSIPKAALVRALERVAQATDKSHPIHSQVRFQALPAQGEKPAVLQLSGTTGLLSVETAARVVVQGEADFGIDCQRLLQSARLMPDGEEPLLLEHPSQGKLLVACGRRQHRLPVLTDELARPTIPQASEQAKTLDVERGTLKRLVQRMRFACPGDGFPNRNGLVIRRHEGNLDAAVMGDPLFTRMLVIYDGSGTWEAQMVPELALSALEELCQPGEERILLSYDEHHIYCRTEDTLLVTVVPHQPFLDIERLFGALPSSAVGEVRPAVWQKAINSVLLKKDADLNMVLSKDGEAHLFVNTDAGQAEDWMPVANAVDWGFLVNASYLNQTLRSCIGTTVRIRRARNALVLDDGAGFLAIIALLESPNYDYDSPRDGVAITPRGGDQPKATEAQTQRQQQQAEQEAADSPKHRAAKDVAKKTAKRTAKKTTKKAAAKVGKGKGKGKSKPEPLLETERSE